MRRNEMSRTMTRGQEQDLVSRLASEDPEFREAMIRDPKAVIEKQFGAMLPESVRVKAIVEGPRALHVIVPAVAKEGELDDTNLEKVAGGCGKDVRFGAWLTGSEPPDECRVKP
jgi:hypothetical protein